MVLARYRCSGKTLWLMAVTFSAASCATPDPREMTAALRNSVPSIRVARPQQDSSQFFAGHFSSAAEIAKSPPPELSGEDLYLFPDKSYINVEWADILPDAIYDKGRWEYEGDYVRLHSDYSVPKNPKVKRDPAFAPFFARVSGRERLFLVGVPWMYSYFRQHAEPLDEFMFLLCSYVRRDRLPDSVVAPTKRRLMRDSWHPDFFSQ